MDEHPADIFAHAEHTFLVQRDMQRAPWRSWPGLRSQRARGGVKTGLSGEYQRWQKRDLSALRYVYVWADGVYLQARMEPQAE